MATGLELAQLLEAGATLAARDYTDAAMLRFIAERVGASEALSS
jgi:phosphoglycolate phosphatase